MRRGLRGRGGVATTIAIVLAMLALGASTAIVVAVAGHRSPPSVAVGTRPLPPAPSTGATAPPSDAPEPTGAVAAASATATAPAPAPPATAPSPASSPPATVRVDETTEAVTIRVGTLLDVELHGDPSDRWSEPDTPTPALLERLSGSADATTGNAQATFRAVAAGDAVVMIQRTTSCSSGPNGGVCGVQARRIAVTVSA
ncbi:MAG TPA: hypothetical protein VMU20_22085 [Candidatus Dormibacteraeota bacterium]|nr:hypothetical protein [Candidatus Dormibacteraeota bacterium]